MTTALFTHPACLEHDTGPGHPERIARLQSVLRRLEEDEFSALARYEAPRATVDEIARVHDRDYVEATLGSIPENGWRRLDADTVVSPGSGEAALRAAGAVRAAVDLVIEGRVNNAFCAVRPPGHHAEPATSMGFCLFNNVAIGALQARAIHSLERVAVIDFDVHHGNGTQAMFEKDASLFFGSTHQMPLYPGTGARAERGLGNIVNAPLPPGANGPAFRAAFEGEILPALETFQPELILISAGFDAHGRDPLAQLDLREVDFAWATERLVEAARRLCGGRLVSTLEGGYDLTALADSVAVHLHVLMAA